MKKVLSRISLGCILLAAAPLCWSQADNAAAQAEGADATNTEERMVAPTPVGVESYPMDYTSDTRTNYLEGGVSLNSAYTDNLLGGVSDHPVSDVSYSVWPTLTFDLTRSRLHSFLSYAPGFTFYQRTSARNQADQNLSLDLEYRLSEHTTLTLVDSFRRSSNVLNQQERLSVAPVSGATDPFVQSVIPPVADQLNNSGKAEITYQFAANGMLGISGSATDLHYPNPAEVPGLYDSNSRGGSAFYSHRLSGKHYIGWTYQYQLLRAFPTGFRAETTTHSGLFFYTAYLRPTLSISLFGGPQLAITQASVAPSSHVFSPGAGASFGWQGRWTAMSASYSKTIASGGGLIGAVHQDSATVGFRRQLTRMLSLGAGGSYVLSSVLTPIDTFSTGGHMISGSVSLRRQLGEHFNCEFGYERLHQIYDNIPLISNAPDTNREWVSISYQFARPLGR